MGVKLVASGGGSVEINPPSTSANFIATMPAGTGTVSVNGVSSNIVLGTAQNSTSGTSIDFTGIPPWIRRITVMFNSVSTNGGSPYQIQLGTSGGFVTTGYTSGVNVTTSTTGLLVVRNLNSGTLQSGILTIANISGNNWVSSGVVGANGGNTVESAFGTVPLSGVLDRVRVTTVNGTDVFDAGSINIMYE